MEYIINEENINEKIIIPKKNYYCCNCNRKGHIYKNCIEPIISNGIIGIYIKNFNKVFISTLENYLINNIKIFNKNYKNNKFKCNFYTWLENNSKMNTTEINYDIKFLMVQRKNSLGYLEFIRGRYNLDDINSISYLLEQMTPEEIELIINFDFDNLWNNLWDINNIKIKNHHKVYILSKQKFYQLKTNNLELLKNIKVSFKFNEWGFPKGRRELYESDFVCAIREFEEETSFNEERYSLLENCKYIRENLIGTNGINYAHNYFLAILDDDNDCLNNFSNREIGNIRIMNINECIEVIRPYHKNKVKIIKSIYNIINNFINDFSDVIFN